MVSGIKDEIAAGTRAIAELSSALEIEVRMGTLAAHDALRSHAEMNAMLLQRAQHLAVADDEVATASSLVLRFDLGLRAGDALHLAIAIKRATPLVTLDRRLASAASALGCAVIVPS